MLWANRVVQSTLERIIVVLNSAAGSAQLPLFPPGAATIAQMGILVDWNVSLACLLHVTHVVGTQTCATSGLCCWWWTWHCVTAPLCPSQGTARATQRLVKSRTPGHYVAALLVAAQPGAVVGACGGGRLLDETQHPPCRVELHRQLWCGVLSG